jgi:hypothetical protein
MAMLQEVYKNLVPLFIKLKCVVLLNYVLDSNTNLEQEERDQFVSIVVQDFLIKNILK